jgi:hypothetical protein
VLYLALSRIPVTRLHPLPKVISFEEPVEEEGRGTKSTLLGDLEKDGVLFLTAVPNSETYFVVTLPFVSCKAINSLLVGNGEIFFRIRYFSSRLMNGHGAGKTLRRFTRIFK